MGLLELYDVNHNKIGLLPYAKDIKVERDLQGGDVLSFSYPKGTNVFDIFDIYGKMKLQAFIRTPDQEYIIKEKNPGEDEYATVVAKVNTEDLKSVVNDNFTRTNVTLDTIANAAIPGTGWTVNSDVTRLRSLSMTYSTALDILLKLAEVFMCDIKFDAVNKIVYFSDSMGSDKGAYFLSQLNLKSLSIQNNGYDFCTRLIPIGQNGLKIDTVNNNVSYVENYQYCNQVITAYWQADQYIDKNALKEDAVKKLETLSTPAVFYQADVIDLSKLAFGYSMLDYSLGDTILLQDRDNKLRQKVRIVKTTEYLDDPTQNSVEISSRYEQLEDIISKILLPQN